MSWKEDLDVFFKPKTIAVVGAPSGPKSWGSFLVSDLPKNFSGKVYLVNPSHSEIQGVKSYKSVSDIPDEVDFAMIVTPNSIVPSVLEDCIAKGVKAGIVFGAGFREAGRVEKGGDLQNSMAEISNRGKLRICGPNCMGIINNVDRLSAMAGQKALAGNVAMVSQSGALAASFLDRMQQKGLGVSYVVTSGNEAVLSTADYLSYIVDQPQTKVIGLYTETVNEPEKFLKAADKALKLHKPIVAIKVGKTEAGAKRALSHTGSMAGSYDVFKGIMRQHGIILVNTLNEFVETLSLFSKLEPRPELAQGGPIYSGPSGGGLALLSDVCFQNDFTPPQLSEGTKEELSKVLPQFADLSNPLDVTGDGGVSDLYLNCFRAAAKDPAISLLVYIPNNTSPAGQFERNIPDLVSHEKEMGKPVVVMTELTGNIAKDSLDLVGDHPLLSGVELGIPVLKNYLWYCGKLRQNEASKDASVQKPKISAGTRVSISQGFELLQDYGIPVAGWRLVKDQNELLKAADDLGYPLVLKPNTGDIVHKSNLGLVAVNLKNKEQLLDAYAKMVAETSKHSKDTSVVVQGMIANGTEVALGSITDPIFGSVVMLGLGGVFIELLKDYSFRRPPLHEQDAEEMISDLKSKEIIKGFRGKPGIDRSKLKQILVNYSRLIRDNPEIKETDINPLIATEDGIHAVDVRLITN